MSKDIKDLLGWQQLCGTVKTVKSGIPDPLPESFSKVTDTVTGDTGFYYKHTGTRRTAKQAQYGAPARQREQRPLSRTPVKLIHYHEKLQLSPYVLECLHSTKSYENDRGAQELDRQLGEFGELFNNSRIASRLSLLANGKIYFDADGELLHTSSGAKLTVDFQIPANNLNQLNSIIAATWATASTDIPTQLRNLQDQAAKLTGYPLKYAFYGANIPTYLLSNNYYKEFFYRNTALNDRDMRTNELPDFGDLIWVPVHKAFFADSGDTNRNFFGADQVTFTPEPSADWWGVMEGTYPVPRSVNVMRDGPAALSQVESVAGKFGYAQMTIDPVGLGVWAGDTQIPILKNPEAIFIADVTP